MHENKVRLAPGYRLQVADLMREVEVADTFTLGDLCALIQDCEELELETLSALVRCPLAPSIAECLQPCDPTASPASDLSAIRLRWRCEYDRPDETRWPPSTALRLEVDGLGDAWEEYKPGGPWYEPGKDYSKYNSYALDGSFPSLARQENETPKERPFKEQVRRRGSGEEELIPWEDVRKEGEGQGSPHRIRS